MSRNHLQILFTGFKSTKWKAEQSTLFKSLGKHFVLTNLQMTSYSWLKVPVCLIFVTFLWLSARLQAAVVLNPRYPEITPIFSLSLLWKGERSGRTDDNLRVRTVLEETVYWFQKDIFNLQRSKADELIMILIIDESINFVFFLIIRLFKNILSNIYLKIFFAAFLSTNTTTELLTRLN